MPPAHAKSAREKVYLNAATEAAPHAGDVQAAKQRPSAHMRTGHVRLAPRECESARRDALPYHHLPRRGTLSVTCNALSASRSARNVTREQQREQQRAGAERLSIDHLIPQLCQRAPPYARQEQARSAAQVRMPEMLPDAPHP